MIDIKDLNLTRPLVWLDVETHGGGGQPEDEHIIELGFHIDYPDKEPITRVSYIKPGVAITAEGTAVHHITNEMVAEAKPFKDYAEAMARAFSNCDFGGYNVRFDLRVISSEMQRAGVQWSYKGANIVDSFAMWRVAKPRSLSDAVREYLGREPTEAHRALGDAQDARDVALAQWERYEVLPRDLAELHKLLFPAGQMVDEARKFKWIKGEACWNFGKYFGKPLRATVGTDPRYFEWVLKNVSMPQESKQILVNALSGMFPKPQ